MDITPFRDLKIGPRAVFDSLPARRSRVRFLLPKPVPPLRISGEGPGGEVGDWPSVTWGAFAQQIERAALFLLGAGLKAGDRAAIFSSNRVEWMSAALGIQAAGGVLVPVYPANTAEQLAYVVAHSDARFLFVDSAPLLQRVLLSWSECAAVERVVLLDDALDAARVLQELRASGKTVPMFAEVERKTLSWSRAMTLGAALGVEQPRLFSSTMEGVSLDQPGLMLYTSGTSGNPKGVPLTHRNVAVNGLDWLTCNAPLIDEGSVDLLWLPMSHIFGFGEACLGNTLGFTTYLCDPLTVMNRLPEVQPNVFMSVPSVWEKLATQASAGAGGDAAKISRRLAEVSGGRLRFCLSGGAGLKREVKELFHQSGILIIEGYGLTETSPTLTLNRPDAFRFDSVGKPLPSVQLKLAEDGEILAKGPNVFAGYHKDPAATHEIFTSDGWLKTGDVGRFTDDGFLQIVDRKKDILVTAGGKNVPPANIELRFQNDPFIAHLVVYGEGKRFLVAGVWLNPEAIDAHLKEAGIGPEGRGEAVRALVQRRIDQVNSELASYETIKKFAVMDSPLTVPNGLLTATLKVRRKKVNEAFRSHFEALYE